MSKCAIVITYDGSEPDKLTMTRIVEALSTSGYMNNTERGNIFFLNEKDVLSALVAHAAPKAPNVSEDGFNEEERAVILIGTLCSKTIGDIDAFTSELANKYMRALILNNNPDLVAAVELIAKTKSLSNIRAKIKSDYNFYSERYKAVCNIYKAKCLGHIGE